VAVKRGAFNKDGELFLSANHLYNLVFAFEIKAHRFFHLHIFLTLPGNRRADRSEPAQFILVKAAKYLRPY
jgi:hypothetical protein